MKNRSNYRSHWHCVFDIKLHIVLVTKYRKKCLNKSILERLHEHCEHVCVLWGTDLLEFGGESDHIHLLISMHPNVMPSKFINNLKTITSRFVRKEFGEHLKKYYWKKSLWTRAYCLLSSGGAPIDIIKKYIEKQGKNDDSSPTNK